MLGAVLLWTVATADAGSAMKEALRWAKTHEEVLSVDTYDSWGTYWRWKKKKDRTIYFTLRTKEDAKEVTFATDYVALDRIPDAANEHGAWGYRSTDRDCRARTGLTAGERHVEGLSCSLDWLDPEGTVIQRYDDIAGIWLNFGSMQVVDGVDLEHPRVVAMVQRQDDEVWFQFIDVHDHHVTTPWLPDIAIVGDASWEVAAIPLPSGELWPIGDDGNKVGERPTIAGYTPIYEEAGSSKLWGWVVRHRMSAETTLLGIADRHGVERVPPEFTSFTMLDDGWVEVTDRQGRYRRHPLRFLDHDLAWAETPEAAVAVVQEAMEAERARWEEAQRLAAVEAARQERFRVEYEAKVAQQRWELNEIRWKYEKERQEQQAYCRRVVADCESDAPPSVSDLDLAVRTCEKHLDPVQHGLLQRTRHQLLTSDVPPPKRFSIGQALANGMIHTPASSVRYGSSSYTENSGAELERIRDRAAQDRADARFDQFMDYISGSSSYNPNETYRETR